MVKLVLDAGHGLGTSGKCTPDGTREFEFNGPVAQYVKDYLLSKYGGIQIKFSHDPTGRVDVDLDDRVAVANNWDADAFVSIHFNAYGLGGWEDGAHGIETFTSAGGPNSTALQKAIHPRLIKATGRKDRGMKETAFYVLRKTKMGAVLLECGFMTNRAEAKLMRSDAYRRKCAQAIAEGIADRFNLKAKPKPAPAPSGVTYRVVTGSFSDKDNAERRVADLKKKGFDSFIDAVKL